MAARVKIYDLEENTTLPPTLRCIKAYNLNILPIVSQSSTIWNLAHALHKDDLWEEHCFVVGLNAKNKILGVSEISWGGICSSAVDKVTLFRRAILMGSTGIIMWHNHPSGDPTPSQTDIEVTLSVIEGCKTVGLGFLDHLIVTPNDYCSIINVIDAEDLKRHDEEAS